MSEVEIKEVDWGSQERDNLVLIRKTVFVDEQKVPEDIEWDEDDEQASHFLALIDNKPIGCGRLKSNGQLSRLSVLPDYRNNGIGRELLNTLENKARSLAYPEVFLHAQTHATSFYEAAGYTTNGGVFMEANIPHRLMNKELKA